jgi:preprotein translocase subunit SecG
LGLAYFGSNRPHASVGGGVMEHVTVPVKKAPAPGDAIPTTVPAPAAAPAASVPAAPQDVPAAPAPAPAK